ESFVFLFSLIFFHIINKKILKNSITKYFTDCIVMLYVKKNIYIYSHFTQKAVKKIEIAGENQCMAKCKNACVGFLDVLQFSLGLFSENC
uniref:Uncharacterized protein n=1 Tax=Kryptolebias marmoratus TaxID=37003 RepID=A0A3Q2ZTA5_KRYMA